MSDLAPDALAGLFAETSDKKLLATVALIDRLPRRGSIDDLLAPVRPRLKRLKPPRPMTLRRLLTVPLEELLVPAVDWRPGSLRLSRDLLAVIHGMVLDKLPAELRQATEQAVAGRAMDETAFLQRTGASLWPEAAKALQAALEAAPDKGDGKGRNRRQQLEIAAGLLAIGEPLGRVFAALPIKPVRYLAEDQYPLIGQLMKELERMGGRALALGSEALGQRLGDSATLLQVLQKTGDASASRLAVATDAARRVVGELDASADQLRRAGRQPAAALAADVVRLVDTIGALEAAPTDLPIDRGNLKQVRLKAAKAIEGHLQNVVNGEVLDGFRTLCGTTASDAAVAAVESAARAARQLGAAGRQLGLKGQVDLVVKAAFADYRKALTQPAAGPDASGEEQVMDQLRIVEIVFGADAAAELLMARHQGAMPKVA